MKNSWTKKLVAVITWRWRMQLALNLPLILLWVADKSSPAVHRFDLDILKTLKAEWLAPWIGLT